MNETERFWHLAQLQIARADRLIEAALIETATREARAELLARHGGIYAPAMTGQGTTSPGAKREDDRPVATTTYTLTITTDHPPEILDAAVREALFSLADELAPPVVTTATAEPPPASGPVSIALADPYGVRETFNVIAGGGGYVATPSRPPSVTVTKP